MADLERVRRWADALIELHLDAATWTFAFDNAKKRAGLCNYTERRISVSRYLERIADHATNIAEDVIYLVDGAIVRHRPVPAARGDDDNDR